MCLAVPGKIIEIRGDDPFTRMGTVDFGGVSKEINLSFVPDAGPGSYVLVHAGFALDTIDEDEAAKVFEYLRQIDELASHEDAEAAGAGGPGPREERDTDGSSTASGPGPRERDDAGGPGEPSA